MSLHFEQLNPLKARALPEVGPNSDSSQESSEQREPQISISLSPSLYTCDTYVYVHHMYMHTTCSIRTSSAVTSAGSAAAWAPPAEPVRSKCACILQRGASPGRTRGCAPLPGPVPCRRGSSAERVQHDAETISIRSASATKTLLRGKKTREDRLFLTMHHYSTVRQ